MNYHEYEQLCYLNMLLTGEMEYSNEQLCEYGARIGIDLSQRRWFCAVLGKRNDAGLLPWLRFPPDIRSMCEKSLKTIGLQGYALIDARMNPVILFEGGEVAVEHMQAFLKVLTKSLRSDVCIGIGEGYEDLRLLHCSKAEAYEALSMADDQLPVASICDVYRQRSASSAISKNNRMAIIEKFRQGNLDGMESELNMLAEFVRAKTVVNPDAPYPTSIRRTMVEILVEMLHIASDAGLDVDAVIGGQDPYHRIFELRSTPEIIHWMMEVIVHLRDSMLNLYSRRENKLVEQAKCYIEKNLSDMQLSLAMVSGELNMSPAYFSAFFIRETGSGFKEYVNVKRIEAAEKYLRETEYSINAISEKCGFLSASYFITVFKRRVGISPGTYRKKKI